MVMLSYCPRDSFMFFVSERKSWKRVWLAGGAEKSTCFPGRCFTIKGEVGSLSDHKVIRVTDDVGGVICLATAAWPCGKGFCEIAAEVGYL